MQNDTTSYQALTRLRTDCKNQVDYIESLKSEIIKLTGGNDSSTGELNNPSDIYVPTEYFVKEHFGDTLQYKTLAFEKALCALCSNDISRHEI